MSIEWNVLEAPEYLGSLLIHNIHSVLQVDFTTGREEITYYLTIRRKRLEKCCTLVLPLILISLLSSMIFLSGTETRGLFGVMIAMAYVAFIRSLSLPPTSLVIPLIVKLILGLFAINCISTLVALIAGRKSQREKVILIHFFCLLRASYTRCSF